MNSIKVNINKEEGKISIYNNGKGITIEYTKLKTSGSLNLFLDIF